MPRLPQKRRLPRLDSHGTRAVSSLCSLSHRISRRTTGQGSNSAKEKTRQQRRADGKGTANFPAYLAVYCRGAYRQRYTLSGCDQFRRLLLCSPSWNRDYLRITRHHRVVEELFLCFYQS